MRGKSESQWITIIREPLYTHKKSYSVKILHTTTQKLTQSLKFSSKGSAVLLRSCSQHKNCFLSGNAKPCKGNNTHCESWIIKKIHREVGRKKVTANNSQSVLHKILNSFSTHKDIQFIEMVLQNLFAIKSDEEK